MIQMLRDDLRSRLALFRKAERRRKMRKAKRRKRAAFYENPHKFPKRLIEEKWCGVLEVPQDELENHLRTYTAKSQEEVQPTAGLVRLAAPTTPFDMSEPRLKEVRDFVRRAWAGASPGPSGIPYKVYKACPRILQL